MDLTKKHRPKIFISYTIKDGKINRDFLNSLFNKICNISFVYIDLIHNDSTNKQNRVISELISSNYIFLIRTEQTNNSKWVNKEITLGKKLNIPILEFDFNDLVEKELKPITQTINNIIVQNEIIYN